MAKRNLDWNQNKFDRFLKEGRGQGTGKDYKPWLSIQDMPSRGRATRIYSNKTQRIHHFFTDNETRVFYIFNWEDVVTDIREHYPLLDLEDVLKDKDNLELEKMKDKETDAPYVFTTTFLITIKDNNGLRYIARSVKSAQELDRNHTIKMLEIQRRYWLEKGIDWGIITQKDIPVIKAKNIEWVYSSLEDSSERGLDLDTKKYLSSLFMNKMLNNKAPIRKITASFDEELNLETGTGLFLFKYLIATKIITVDMDNKIDVNVSSDNCIKSFKEEGTLNDTNYSKQLNSLERR